MPGPVFSSITQLNIEFFRSWHTQGLLFEPLDFISKLAALVPMPRINLTRFHGIFGPHSKHRAKITQQEVCREVAATEEEGTRFECEKRASMNWAQRLKRAFAIDINICEKCGDIVKVIASIEDPLIINKILTHLTYLPKTKNLDALPISRSPPTQVYSDLKNY